MVQKKDYHNELWKFVKPYIKGHTGIQLVTYDDVSVAADADKANSLNRTLSSFFFQGCSRDIPEYSFPSYDRMPDIIADSIVVLKLLQNLKTNAAPGPDGILNIVLKSCAPVLTMYLVLL